MSTFNERCNDRVDTRIMKMDDLLSARSGRYEYEPYLLALIRGEKHIETAERRRDKKANLRMRGLSLPQTVVVRRPIAGLEGLGGRDLCEEVRRNSLRLCATSAGAQKRRCFVYFYH